MASGYVPRPGSRSGRTANKRRPSSASSYSSSHVAKGDIGCSPWQPLIEGGNHASYSGFGCAQLQPQLGEDSYGSTRTVPAYPALPGGANNHKVSTSEIRTLIASAIRDSSEPSQRKLTLCPQMRCKGVCRLPSCPFVHEVCRSRKEHTPLFSTNAPKSCKSVPCRFLKVMGLCPYADACVYSHSLVSSSQKPQPEALGTASEIVHEMETTEEMSSSATGADIPSALNTERTDREKDQLTVLLDEFFAAPRVPRTPPAAAGKPKMKPVEPGRPRRQQRPSSRRQGKSSAKEASKPKGSEVRSESNDSY